MQTRNDRLDRRPRSGCVAWLVVSQWHTDEWEVKQNGVRLFWGSFLFFFGFVDCYLVWLGPCVGIWHSDPFDCISD